MMRKGRRSRNIMGAIELLLSDREWYGLYDFVDLTACSTRTIIWLMGRMSVERKKVSKCGVEGTYYRLMKEEKEIRRNDKGGEANGTVERGTSVFC
jgi:hypothetical protein